MTLRLILAQINPLVGDVVGNADQVIAIAREVGANGGAGLVIFPELTLTGYPPEDLLLRPELSRRVEAALARIARECQGVDLLLGYPSRRDGRLYNAAGLIRDGGIVAEYHKQALPNYSVFDEKRYFEPGDAPCLIDLDGVAAAVTVCEDIWTEAPAAQAAAAGARLLLNINASPFHAGKAAERAALIGRRARANGFPIVYLNLFGGQDELVFDGGSFVVDRDGRMTQRLPFFEQAVTAVELEVAADGEVRPRPAAVTPEPSEEEGVYRALVLGVGDYVHKNGFGGAVLGLSGGIDSALTLAIAVDALGAERVSVVSMPSRFTAAISNADAAEQARRLGVDYHVIPIEPAFSAFLGMLAEVFADAEADVTEENIQARCRGVVLMAISNKQRRILLTTGNKSEMAVGYATLYGDMAGGFAPIKDVPKLLVYRLAEYRNRIAPVIPRRVIERPPSAELRPDQQDSDSLPPYEVLDPILLRYVEEDRSVEEIIAEGYDAALVRRIATLVDRNEYKRRQAPPGVRISRRAFGRDRRYPLTSGF